LKEEFKDFKYIIRVVPGNAVSNEGMDTVAHINELE